MGTKKDLTIRIDKKDLDLLIQSIDSHYLRTIEIIDTLREYECDDKANELAREMFRLRNLYLTIKDAGWDSGLEKRPKYRP